jgi:methyl-accepting chemotaxis protein
MRGKNSLEPQKKWDIHPWVKTISILLGMAAVVLGWYMNQTRLNALTVSNKAQIEHISTNGSTFAHQLNFQVDLLEERHRNTANRVDKMEMLATDALKSIHSMDKSIVDINRRFENVERAISRIEGNMRQHASQ